MMYPMENIYAQAITRMKMGKVWAGITETEEAEAILWDPAFPKWLWCYNYARAIQAGKCWNGFFYSYFIFLNSFEKDTTRQNDTIAFSI